MSRSSIFSALAWLCLLAALSVVGAVVFVTLPAIIWFFYVAGLLAIFAVVFSIKSDNAATDEVAIKRAVRRAAAPRANDGPPPPILYGRHRVRTNAGDAPSKYDVGQSWS